MNIFEHASRIQLRFSTVQGVLSVEDLWDLPLTSTRENRASLDNVSRDVLAEKAAVRQESLVEVAGAEDKVLELRIAILKRIIEVRKAENEAKKQKNALQQKMELLQDAKVRAEANQIANMSPEQIAEEEAKLKAQLSAV